MIAADEKIRLATPPRLLAAQFSQRRRRVMPQAAITVALKISPTREPGGAKPTLRGVALSSQTRTELRLAAEDEPLAALPAASTRGLLRPLEEPPLTVE
jgi:hypothetical protein